MHQHETSPLLTVGEALDRLRICRTTLYRLTKSGELESVRIRGRLLIPADAIDSLVARHRQ